MAKEKNKVFIHIALFFFVYSSLYIIRTALSVSADFLCTSGILSLIQYSLAGSLFFVSYASGRFINGYIGDYVQPRFLISLGICLSGICSIVIGLFPISWVILIAWTVNAFAQSMVWSPILVYVVSDKLKNEKFVISLLGASIAVGTVLGTMLIPVILEKTGLKLSFLIPGLISILLGVLVLLVCRENIDLGPSDRQPNNPFKIVASSQFRTLIVPFAINGMLKDGIPIWMFVYITKKYGVDLSQVSGFVILIPILGGLSRLFYEPCRKVFNSEITLAFVSYILAIVFAFALGKWSLPLSVAIISLALLYSFASISNMSFVGIFPLRYHEEKCTSLVSGLVDLIIYAGAGLSTLVFGFIVDRYGFESMFFIWSVLIAVAVVFLFFFVKRFEKSKAI